MKSLSIRSGLSLAEIIMAIGFFVLLFTVAMRGYIESNLPAQAMIRDYAIAMNLCEKLMNQTENRIKSGDIPAAGSNDITVQLLDNPDYVDYFSRFAGGVKKTNGQLVVNFRIILEVEPVVDTDIFAVGVDFFWTDTTNEKNFGLKGFVCKEKSLTLE